MESVFSSSKEPAAELCSICYKAWRFFHNCVY